MQTHVVLLLLSLVLFLPRPAQGQAWLHDYLNLEDGLPSPDSVVAALEAEMQTAENQPAPSFTFRSLDGTEEETLTDYSGRTVVVNLWKTNCSGCRLQLPNLSKLQEKYVDQDVQVIYISPEDRDVIERFLETQYVAGRQRTAPSQELPRPYQLLATPSAFVVDPEGIVRETWIGPATYEELERYVRPHLASR